MRVVSSLLLAAMIGAPPAAAGKTVDEKLWDAARKGNADKVERLLAEEGITAESRLVALSVAVSNDEPDSFAALWRCDNSDIAPDALDYALCYAHLAQSPRAEIAAVLEERGLTADVCCRTNEDQPYCAGRALPLTDVAYPATRCETVYIDEADVPDGAVRIAKVWDERVSVLDPAGSAKYGTPDLSPAGSKRWALEFSGALGALGANAILIVIAERSEEASSSLVTDPRNRTLSGFKYGTVVDRIELVGLRTSPHD